MNSRVVGWCLFVVLSCIVLIMPVRAQQANEKPASSSLVQLLQNKGILNREEVAELSRASSPSEADRRLGQLLVDKGLISEQEYKATYATTAVSMPMDLSMPRLINAVYNPQAVNPASAGQPGSPQATKPEPAIIPAVAPVRVLPIDLPKQAGLIPDIQLGSGAKMKLYGFFKASAVSETASSGGPTFGSQDWPLPLLIGGDTGPTSDPQVHIKARAFRIGSQFEWVPKGSSVTVTGRLEGDFEGDYTNVNNRSISGVRSSQFSIRLAWVRLDGKLGALPVFTELGQDWTLVSSTLPSLFETTGTAIAQGALWERLPMFKVGAQFHSGDLKIQPEFAIVLPAAGSATLTDEQRARFGDRAGSESNQPGLEARMVFQFPLSHSWKGVVPAQIIFSGHHARMNEIIPFGNLPTIAIPGAVGCTQVATNCSIRQFFPTGLQLGNPQNIWTAEVQLPTPWFTIAAKYYSGDDMRFFFAGQVNDVFTDLGTGVTQIPVGAGAAGIIAAPVTSFSGRQISFGCAGATGTGSAFNCNAHPVVASVLRPIRGEGGFADLSFPLSRIFHANPEGRNSGWILHLLYGTDRERAQDARHLAGTGGTGSNNLLYTNLESGSLTYRLNKWVTFVQETSYINTREVSGVAPKTFRGLPATAAHNWRNEFGTVFTF